MKDVLQVLLVAAVILAVGAAGYRLLFGGGEIEPLSIQRVEGAVQLVNADGSRVAEQGAVLGRSDRVVAGEGGRAVLGLGEETRLVLHAASSLRVLGQDADGLQVELEGGRVQATVRPGSGAIAVLAGGREVQAEDASFAVGLGIDGTTVVETSLGEVELVGFSDIEAASAGQRVTVGSAGAATLGPIPEALLLDVQWPEAVRTRAQTVRLSGATHPGARISAKTEEVEVDALADADGRFSIELPLEEGLNTLQVFAVDPLGKEQEVSWSITRDSKKPIGEFTFAPH